MADENLMITGENFEPAGGSFMIAERNFRMADGSSGEAAAYFASSGGNTKAADGKWLRYGWQL